MFIDSTLLTPFPLKILMWETAVRCSPFFNWETEAGEGVALPREQGHGRGVPGQPGLLPRILPGAYQHLAVGG